MTEISKKYYSKVLLIGEYTVTTGYSALALPFKGFSGQWMFESNHDYIQTQGLQTLLYFIQKKHDLCPYYDITKFEADLNHGLIFKSDIPEGYGLGSSGSLVAGFYDRYCIKKSKNLKVIKKVLAETESAFHGASSGIDPLISYLNCPVITHGDGKSDMLELDISGLDFYLFDTGIKRKTSPLISIFQSKLKTDNHFRSAVKLLGNLNQEAINHVIHKDNQALAKSMKKISTIQFDHFREMIPKDIIDLWDTGLKSGHYYFKLCGAGGGGMMLCYFPKGRYELFKGVSLIKVE